MISDLRDVSHFSDTATNRGWHAWWTDSAVPLSQYRSWVQYCIDSSGIPTCLVAHDSVTYYGSVSLIASDMEQRPSYTPWIAALWVEEAQRRQGIAAALVERARAVAKLCGYDKPYLCAAENNSPYYRAREFSQIETAVNDLNVFEIVTV